MELPSPNIEKISGNGNPPKKFHIFQEIETLKRLLMFQEPEPFSPPRESFL